MRAPTISNPGRELARRVSGGIKITLYWNADDNTTSIEIRQPETKETLSFAVDGDQALDAFYHPFAHLPAVRSSDDPAQPTKTDT
jgi:hypothetical protein